MRLLREEIQQLRGREEENRLALHHLEQILEVRGNIHQLILIFRISNFLIEGKVKTKQEDRKSR